MDNNNLIGKKTKPTTKPEPSVDFDVSDTLATDIVEAAKQNILNISALDNFTNIAQGREQMYMAIDNMANDSTISSVLETYTEDTTVPNEQGRIIWCESDDADIQKFVTFLLDNLNIDKNAYSWVQSMYKYGDLYLRLFKESDYKKDILFDADKIEEKQLLHESNNANKDNKLNEDVYLRVNSKSDRYVPYVELIHNPGEMFELTQHGKTVGYIRAPINIQNVTDYSNQTSNYLNSYRLKKNDVEIYQATDFVHGCLEDNVSRATEEVNIYMNDADYETDTNATTYHVKRGQSMLYNSFKIWRQLSLLENSVLLDRLTKSSVLRLVQIEVGTMGKEEVQQITSNVKALFEQKAGINTDLSYTEYTNPGPIQNTVYLPVHEGKGAVNVQTIGGDVDPKSLIDIEYYRDKLFASLKAPKQFFGFTDDSTGFNGGTSLTIISSRYGKSVKRGQNAFIQTITDLINIILYDRGMISYINKYALKMTEPVTQEQIDRKEAETNSIRVMSDVMTILDNDIDSKATKLKIKKSLLTPIIANTDVIQILQEQIEELEKEESEQPHVEEDETDNENPFNHERPSMVDIPDENPSEEEMNAETQNAPEENDFDLNVENEEPYGESLDTTLTEDEKDIDLPSGEDLGIDLTKNY